MTTEYLHFSTEMLRRLGEELNPHADQGILELVRNAYDADATECVVELEETQFSGGTVRVIDNGTGMSTKSIRDGWLVLGKSEKVGIRQTERKRFPIGNKGIGRLAALRLGRKAVLITRPEEEPSLEHSLEIDWDRFDDASFVDQVPLQITTGNRPPAAGDGTVVEISDLRSRLSKPDVKRLARALILLSDPFRGDGASTSALDFRPVLRAKEFEDLERLVARGYRDEADFYLRAELDEKGRARARVRTYIGEELFRAEHPEITSLEGNRPYAAPAAVFELWWFVLSSKNFSPRAITLGEVREWLAEFGGVHLYHRGMRVSPYSDFDWLEMNLRRARSPEARPSTNNSIGRLAVLDPLGLLRPKTDRLGFVEDEPYRDLRRFGTDVLDWFAYRMLKRREERRGDQKEKAAKSVRRAERKLKAVVDTVPQEAKETVKKAIVAYDKAKQRQTNTLKEDLQLYRTLGTVGTTAAAFAHQAKAPLVHIASSARTLESEIAKNDLFLSQLLSELAGDIRINAESLLSFAKVTLGLLQHEKRRRGQVSVHSSVKDVVLLLKPYIELRQVKVDSVLDADQETVLASRAAIESVLTNLLINSLKSFEDSLPGERLIVIRTRNLRARPNQDRQFIQLSVLDNGPGIRGLSVGDIWLPGMTTTTEGTGLGLTIVRDVIRELGGRVGAEAQGELGGAEIMVDLPVSGGS